MRVRFIAPVDHAHLEIFFSIPVLDPFPPETFITLQGQAHTEYFDTTATINSTLTYSGRLVLVSPTFDSPLSAHIGPIIEVDIQGLNTVSDSLFRAFAQTSKRETTTLTAKILGG